MARFVVRFSLDYGWHIVDTSDGLIVDEFGQYHDEAQDFCETLNHMWAECAVSYDCPVFRSH